MATTPTPGRRSSRRIPRPAHATALLAALAVTLTACGTGESGTGGSGDGPGGGASGDPVAGGTLRYAFANTIDCVDPRQRPQLTSRNVGRQLGDQLTEQDPETKEIKPWLATSWEISDDVSQFTFHLREDVTFSDGAPFDAEAVKANFDAIVDLGARAPQAGSFLAGYEGSTVLDTHTVRVDFDGPNAQFLQTTATASFVQLSPASLGNDPADLCLGDFAASGPFTLGSFTPEKSVELIKREDYAWASPIAANQGPAYVDRIVLEVVPEGGVRYGSVTSDQIDLADGIPFTNQAELANLPGYGLATGASPGIAIPYIPLASSPELQDPDVRRALSLGIDRQAIVDAIFQGTQQPATGVLTAATPGWTDQSAEIRHDPEAAIALLEGAGYDRVGADGIRENADGDRLSLTITYQSGSTDAEAQHQLVQQEWKEIGVELVLDPVATLPDVPIDEFPGDLTTWSQGRADVDVIRLVYGSSHPEMSMLYNHPDAELDALLDSLQSTVDPDERQAIGEAAQQRIIEQGYTIPVYDRFWSYGYGPSVGGFRADIEGKPLLNEVWIAS
ncbi:ABC transporter substrate-binding protein [Streptomyces harbinensis]|uniref:Peptide/nickel transport system substrate-binding protein n=1 Tax=Streptomyces harbinensis TaxID=1176198 RepID=A0A1I6UQR0_9ACTN|nr:ABC transporter substrate-binding protein [Streptomyces harbinensis]SFT03723.1 peptide/nickel transport system substrate-binding protein [Streptomyces harbinensis]